MNKKITLYLYRLRVLFYKNRRADRTMSGFSNISGTAAFGYGHLNYFISKEKYDIGKSVILQDNNSERRLLLGILKERKKISVNIDDNFPLPVYFPFFLENYSSDKGKKEDEIDVKIVHKITELKDYEIYYE